MIWKYIFQQSEHNNESILSIHFMKSKIFSLFSKKQAATAPEIPAEGADTARFDQLILEGQQHEDQGHIEAALKLYQEALAMQPRSASALINIGNAKCLQSDNPAALECYQRAVDFEPENTSALFNLGRLQIVLGQFAQAVSSYRRVVSKRPDWVDAQIGLACAFEGQNEYISAISSYRSALALDPTHTGAASNLSSLLLKAGQGAEARKLLEEQLQQAPDDIGLLVNLSELERDTGRVDESIAILKRIVSLRPDHLGSQAVYLFSLNLSTTISGIELKEAHAQFGRMLESSITPRPERPRKLSDGSRRLKVGYVSPDLSRHPVANFIAPVLRDHDRDAVEVFCYSTGRDEDDITVVLRQRADHWRAVFGWSDEALVDAIRADEIDVLVDLSGHTTGGRLEVFAYKPAPVQITWLGYLGTTGLSRIDYRLCDFHADPEGLAEAWHTEIPLRMPDSQWCYEAYTRIVPKAGLSPRLQNGFWTFGSFNNGRKLNHEVLTAWVKLLQSVPGSKLRLYGLQNEDAKIWVRNFLIGAGMAEDCIYISGRLTIDQYLAAYNDVDIALDPFPYNGATTLCDALLCGVPVLAIEGQRSLSRGGVSVLRTIGLQDWIAASAEALPELAQLRLADPEKIAALRKELPARMQASPLMDAPRFCRNLEAQYRIAWQRWCEGGAA